MGISQSAKTNWNASYVEVPVNFIYKPALGNGKMLLGVGPYAAVGMGGKVKGEASGVVNASGDKKLQFLADGDKADNDRVPYAKPFDFGGNLLIGYEFANKISVQLNGQMGLINTAPKNGLWDDFKTSQFGLSLGYKF